MPRGRSAPSARSDSSGMEIDGTESEIAKLQRQFRIMEGDRQAYNIQAREQIRKQQQEIDKLLKEQEEMHRNLGVCKSASRRQQDSGDTQSLHLLLEQRDMIEEELKKEKQCQKELEKEISNMELKLAELRKGDVSTSERQRSEVRRTEKAIRTLEYKLDRALTRFNELLTKNSQLREELQTLHIERGRFQQLHNRLEKELQEVRKKIGEVIHLSTAAYDARVEAQSKMTMMREKAVKDLAQYNMEMKELERVIVHECSLKDFMITKGNERSGLDDSHEIGHRQLSEVKEQRKTDSGEESLDALEQVFERLQTVTGEDNLDILVTKFIQVEDQNFALFNFVNEQNNEAGALRDQISQIQGEMERFQVESLQREQDHRALLRDTVEQQKEAKFQVEDYDNQANIISKILGEIKTGVTSIFSKLECDHSVIEDMLGSSTGISDYNIMSYLGLVEQKTNELLTVQAFLKSKDLEKDYNPKDLATFIMGQNPELLLQKISIHSAINRSLCPSPSCPPVCTSLISALVAVQMALCWCFTMGLSFLQHLHQALPCQLEDVVSEAALVSLASQLYSLYSSNGHPNWTCLRTTESMTACRTLLFKTKGSVCLHHFLQLWGPLPRVMLTSPL
uniref:ODAD1 central coiled coil region domain-containing protein n=1 Tax=Monopterus albus TaxID=43700 RepID=A0A3Q3IKQ0_MONAL|nr:coiled-coil domain-containing protein 63-like isoform X2 [Monopterus albus]